MTSIINNQRGTCIISSDKTGNGSISGDYYSKLYTSEFNYSIFALEDYFERICFPDLSEELKEYHDCLITVKELRSAL